MISKKSLLKVFSQQPGSEKALRINKKNFPPIFTCKRELKKRSYWKKKIENTFVKRNLTYYA